MRIQAGWNFRKGQVSRETLEQACLARIDSEVVELHLRLGPGKSRRPLEGGGVVMLVDEVKQRFTRGCDHGPKGNVYDRAGCDPRSAHPWGGRGAKLFVSMVIGAYGLGAGRFSL